MASSLVSVKIMVSNIERAFGFYSQVCGFEERARIKSKLGAEQIILKPKAGPANFILSEFVPGSIETGSNVVLVLTTDDIVQFRNRLIEAGGEIIEGPYWSAHGSTNILLAYDIDRNIIEAVEVKQ